MPLYFWSMDIHIALLFKESGSANTLVILLRELTCANSLF